MIADQALAEWTATSQTTTGSESVAASPLALRPSLRHILDQVDTGNRADEVDSNPDVAVNKTLPSPASPNFDASETNAWWRKVDGYVFFADIEGLGGPPASPGYRRTSAPASYRAQSNIQNFAEEIQRQINSTPYIAGRAPTEALSALRSQLKNFLEGIELFDRKKKPTQSALAVKIISANPVSMPDERAMSTVTWINSKLRNQQLVSTVSNHSAIRGFSRIEAESQASHSQLRETIHGKPNAGPKPTDGVDSVNGDSSSAANDGLDWLNDGLPDPRSSPSKGFHLVGEFGIQKHLHILADSIRVAGGEVSETVNSDSGLAGGIAGASSKAAAYNVAPKADKWSTV
ncbi:hypothetical protein B0H13DRAFT_1851182 [Mycena leptocephala]|nr:hypothetical protein B0H13DRAFT_1851182 [Mycena leptocephala]